MGDVKLPNPKVSRRFAIAAISALSGAVAMGTTEGEATAGSARPEELLKPLEPGSRFGRWQLEKVEPLDQGAITVTVRGADGLPFKLEIHARDTSPAMPRAPGETAHFAVYVVNEGDGGSPTVEDHGLCAMTLATFIAKNESPATAAAFATLAHRLDLESRGLLQRP